MDVPKQLIPLVAVTKSDPPVLAKHWNGGLIWHVGPDVEAGEDAVDLDSQGDLPVQSLMIHGSYPNYEEVLRECTQIKGLTWLDLMYCKSQGPFDPRVLAAARELEYLHLDDDDALTGENLAWLGDLKSLKIVDISYCENVTSEMTSRFDERNQIENLYLTCCSKLADEALNPLAQCPKLQYLDLIGCAISPEAVATLTRFKALRGLSLNSNWATEHPDALAELRQALPNCDVTPK